MPDGSQMRFAVKFVYVASLAIYTFAVVLSFSGRGIESSLVFFVSIIGYFWSAQRWPEIDELERRD